MTILMLRTKTYVAAITLLAAAIVGWVSAEPEKPVTVPTMLAPNNGQAATMPLRRETTSASDANQSQRPKTAPTSALIEVFKHANDCLLYHEARDRLDALLGDEQWNDLSSLSQPRLKRLDESSAKDMSIVQRLSETCAGTDPIHLADQSVEATFSAALQGDAIAEACFAVQGPTPWGLATTGKDQSALFTRYVRYVPEFRRRALEADNPLIAKLTLFNYTATVMHPSRLDTIPKEDPVLTWRAARLASLRTSDEERLALESQLEAFAGMGWISPAQITAADAWAKNRFDQKYSGGPPIDLGSFAYCYASSDLLPLP